MNKSLAVFEYNEKKIRTTSIEGEPWFVGQDVCNALKIKNHRDAMSNLDSDEKGVVSSDTLGGQQKLNTVNESGLYSLILQSRKPEAKKFKKWITAEVLPALRKTGTYSIAAAVPKTEIDLIIALAQETKQLETRIDLLEAHIETEKYMTVLEYCTKKGIKLEHDQRAEVGMQAAIFSNDNGYPIHKNFNSHWGYVNSYHPRALFAVTGLMCHIKEN